MTKPVAVHPIVSPWGRFGLYSFFIDAPEPAIVDTGIASSPAEGMVPALEAIGRRIEDVRWIFLTHGHIDHIGGAFALWSSPGGARRWSSTRLTRRCSALAGPTWTNTLPDGRGICRTPTARQS